MGRIFMGYWDCEYCGSTDIDGSKLSCPNCGKSRGQRVVFHPTPRGSSGKPRHYVSENTEEYHRATAGPDWVCSYCDSNNRADHPVCRNCGHTKEESDRHYFELHPERENQIVPLDENCANYHPHYSGTIDDDDNNKDDYRQTPYLDSSRHNSDNAGSALTEIVSNIPWGKVCIALLAVALIFGMIYIFIPKERDITVTDVDWQRNVVVEEYRTIRESDWSVPTGGRIAYFQQEIHHYNRILDHYDTVTKSRQVITGSHQEVIGYRDLGNGYFEEITQTVYEYGTEYYTEEEPVYVSVPEYRTKYYYDIERWVYDHTETSSAHDHEPYWPEVELKDNQRINGRDETYGLTTIYRDKENHYTIEYADWCEINVGVQLHVKVHIGGRIEILPDE